MSISLNDIKKKVIENNQKVETSSALKDKASLLRPWQNFKKDKDLVELITNRKNKKNKVKRKSVGPNKANKLSKEDTTEELLSTKIKNRALALFGKMH